MLLGEYSSGMTRRGFFKKVGLMGAVGLGLNVFDSDDSYSQQLRVVGKKEIVYAHFLCDSISNNPNFRGLDSRRYRTPEEIRDGLLDQAVIVRGKKGPNSNLSVGDNFNLVFFQVGFPGGTQITPVINDGLVLPTYNCRGNEWEYQSWPLKAAGPGKNEVVFRYKLPRNLNQENKTLLLPTGVRYHIFHTTGPGKVLLFEGGRIREVPR